MLQTQTAWGWPIALYLFLAGVGAGAYAVGTVLRLARGQDNAVSRMGVYLGGPVVCVSILFLFFDLGNPFRFLMAFLRPQSSMISVGTWVLTLFVIVALFQLLQYFLAYRAGAAQKEATAQVAATREATQSWFSYLGIILAVGVMVYTGVLLGVNSSIPFWNTPLLPILFLISALSTGIGALTLAVLITRPKGAAESQAVVDLHLLARTDMVIIALEILSLLFYILVMFQSQTAAAAAAGLLFSGNLAMTFWLGIVLIGLLVPLVLDWTLLRGKAETIAKVAAAGGITSVCLLTGGLLLRYAVLAAGVVKPFIS